MHWLKLPLTQDNMHLISTPQVNPLGETIIHKSNRSQLAKVITVATIINLCYLRT